MNDMAATSPNPIKRLRSLLKELHAIVAERVRAEEESHAEHKRISAAENATYQKISGEESSRHQSVLRSAESDRDKVHREVNGQLDRIQTVISDTESFLGTVGRKELVGSSSQQRAVVTGVGDMSRLRAETAMVENLSQQIKALGYWNFYHKENAWFPLWGVFAGLTLTITFYPAGQLLGIWTGSWFLTIVLIALISSSILCGLIAASASNAVAQLLATLFTSSANATAIANILRNQATAKCQGEISASEATKDGAVRSSRNAMDAAIQQSHSELELKLNQAGSKWRQSLQRLRSDLQELSRICTDWFPSWAVLENPGWVPRTPLPPAVRFGEFGVTLSVVPKGVSSDNRFAYDEPLCSSIPALAPFPQFASLMIKELSPANRTKIEARDEEVRIGNIYEGRVTSVKKYGAFVSIVSGRDGLCHISELDNGFVKDVADICKPGDKIMVMVIDIDDQDRVKLSRKAALHSSARPSIKQADTKTKPVMCLQAVMLRLLTVIAPGKVRFTVFDPIGLGENFATFMHLADYDEALVTSRIWTEPRQIEQQLEKVTEHMEMVIQKYLRGQYTSIDEYNAEAGEVAEPYRFIVVANFPAKFTQAAAERLLSIASVGRRCGVYVLVSMDTAQKLPREFNLRDLEQHFVRVNCNGNSFVWDDPDFGMWPLRLDEPPASELFTAILRWVGENAKDGNRVEVPFEFIAPPIADFWRGDSRTGLVIPLGRAGATKRQCLQLGQGTAQHVLVAGKTGSGKSTLLHAIITNVGLVYGPDEVELYLVDFKKGVEFKTYAVRELPHARVVAIESEREFGLSVLQRLDAELKLRGDKFRDQAVQDLAAYRQSQPTVRCPRLLLIVDEFQEFFIEDDKIAREAALLLDRLVRQGRAFGIHVILGSQTLGGAYSLARSTIDQMAVRIALQCSDADARLILSDDNSAARLLSRPGEAIYNDANGLVEGNNLFQVVWLPDERRDDYLQRVQELASRRRFVPPSPQIVFEGNIPADIIKNQYLRQLLSTPIPLTASRVWKAWLGEAISIKDPTCAVFRPQGASNLLLVGQQEETAIGLTFASLVSIAAQHPRSMPTSSAPGVRFYLFDGTPADSSYVDVLTRLVKMLPAEVQTVGRKHVVTTVAGLLAEVNHRIKAEEGLNSPTVFLVIHGLQYFRDLRRQDEPLSRRLGEQPGPNPAKDFLTIVREGPPVGIHTILWCDSLTNLNRTLDRQGLREFEMRVGLQMGATDSTTLIEAPIASKLGHHRAYFFHEERGTPEKFRPYGLPSSELQRCLDGIRSEVGRSGGTQAPSES